MGHPNERPRAHETVCMICQNEFTQSIITPVVGTGKRVVTISISFYFHQILIVEFGRTNVGKSGVINSFGGKKICETKHVYKDEVNGSYFSYNFRL